MLLANERKIVYNNIHCWKNVSFVLPLRKITPFWIFFLGKKKYNAVCFYLLVHTYVKRSLLFITNNSVGNGSVTYPNRRNSAIKNPSELLK